MQKRHTNTNKQKENYMEVVPQNECELSDFPSKIQLSINHLKRILIVIILKARQRQWFCKVFLNTIAKA